VADVDVWATAAFAAGPGAVEWLTSRGLSGVLVDRGGNVTTV
jgi:thiamine biosynthesis lipoprotein ApbE